MLVIAQQETHRKLNIPFYTTAIVDRELHFTIGPLICGISRRVIETVQFFKYFQVPVKEQVITCF